MTRPSRSRNDLFLPGSYTNSRGGDRYRDFVDTPALAPAEPGHVSSESEDEGEEASINGRGLEVNPGPAIVARQRANDQSVTPYRDTGDLVQAKDRIWESLANKMLPPEETELMIKRLEKKADTRTGRTYIAGVATGELNHNAPVLRVGLVFMPGADKTQVTRFEQTAMQTSAPDQKNAIWRLNTAGALLKNFEVTADLSLTEIDQTTTLYKRARTRLRRKDSSIQSPQQLNQLSLRDNKDDVVTIDSAHVEIVEDLRGGGWDLEATLIEVDGTSLLSLITNCRHLDSREGPHMSFDETRNLLDMMIEDARRLCVRSPVLFRMSTRTRIINSTNTRYGIDHHEMFRTISTSKGIQEIIRQSAAYYDALDPEGSNDTNQQFIRPRFLQMLALLLSFLNNDDLRDISGLLEATYKIRADRGHLEMLFLKVIPLMSINSQIFLEAIIPAVEGFPLRYPAEDGEQSDIWDIFVQRILAQGYILPGAVNDLGRTPKSWILNWPEAGFKSTQVFRNLQYAGSKFKTINEISPFELHPEMGHKELTVHMVDNKQYVIDSGDLERITKMNTGYYLVVEARPNGRKLDLEIEESNVNSHLDTAIAKINNIIDEQNRWLASPSKKVTKFLRTRKTLEVAMLNNFPSTGRMTRHVALLNQDILTVAYKVEGRKITRKDAWRTMASTVRSVRALLKDLESRSKYLEPRSSARHALVQELTSVDRLLSQADEQRRRIGEEEGRSDDPITQVIYPSNDGVCGPVWHDYEAWYRRHEGLHVRAKTARVKQTQWRADGLVEVSLEGHNSQYIASPTSQGVINPDDEIREGDIATLAGRYLIISESGGANGELIMTNNLRVTNIQEGNSSGRGKLRAARADAVSDVVFI